MAKVFTRRALYDLVWTEPMTVVAKRLGVSDVALSKACHRSDIPTPSRGYWAKLEAGKPAPKPNLPPRGLGRSEEIEIGGSRYGYGDSAPTDAELLSRPLPPPPTFPDGPEAVRGQVRAILGKVSVPKTLANPHPEIAKLLEADEARRLKQLQTSYSWDAPLFSSAIERRRLRLLNGLFLAFSRCGFKCSTDGKQARDAGVRVGDQNISFRLDMLGAKEVHPSYSAPPIPEGTKLSLRLSWWKPPPEICLQWSDTDIQRLEDQVQAIAEELVFAGEWGYRSWQIRRHEHLVERRRELEEEMRKRQQEAERRERERQARLICTSRDLI